MDAKYFIVTLIHSHFDAALGVFLDQTETAARSMHSSAATPSMAYARSAICSR